jgi:hypothetical protein
MIASPPIATAYMESYYAGSMIHATYIWVLKILSIGVFIESKYGSKGGMDGSTLVLGRALYLKIQELSMELPNHHQVEQPKSYYSALFAS